MSHFFGKYFITFIFLSVLFSQDIFISMKRLSLFAIIISSSLLIISYFDKDQLKTILVKASFVGSGIFLLFNIVIIFGWLKFYTLESNFINIEPNMIAYFIPRLSGYSLDVNRGGVVLLFFTYYLYNNCKKTNLLKFTLLVNILSIILTLSRTVYLLSFTLIVIYLLTIVDKTKRKYFIKYIFISIISALSILIYLNQIKIIELEYLIKERSTIDFDLNRFSSSGIHLRLIIDGIKTAFNELKILLLGNGYGTSFLLIHGYYWSGSKYANYHSQYITTLVESGIFSLISILMVTFIIPVINKMYNYLFPFIIGLFLYNIFYQVILEPIYWFIILLFYKEKCNNNE